MSRTCDVYGVGHALVDIQYTVSPEFLRQLDIEKGVMTLIDRDRQQVLFQALHQDPIAKASGGSAANTMIGIAGFGGRAYYACLVGQDEWGDFYQRDLERAGVRTCPVNRISGTTGQCVVFITEDADRTLNTFLGVSAGMGPDQIEAERIAASQYVYLEGYLFSSDSGFAACRQAQDLAHDSGTRVSLTLSDPFMVSSFKDRFEAILDAEVDLLFCNEDEARACTGREDRQTACRDLAQRAASICVTCGAEGAILYERGHRIQIPGVQVEALDTTGAGDLFAGGLLFGITNGYSLEESGRLGSYAAAQVVARYGPRLNRSLKTEIESILASFT